MRRTAQHPSAFSVRGQAGLHHVWRGRGAVTLAQIGVVKRSQLGVNLPVLLNSLVSTISMWWCR